jgi:autotransporter-associated beta strand protein
MPRVLQSIVICLSCCLASGQPIFEGGSSSISTPITYFWQTSDSSNNWTDSANWFLGKVPSSEGSNTVRIANDSSFGTTDISITIDDSVFVDTLLFSGSLFVNFSSSGGTAESINIGAGVNSFSSSNYAEIYFSPQLPVSTSASTYWYLNYTYELEIAGAFTNTESMVIDGGGTVIFSGNNSATFSGTLQVLDAWLGIGHDNALGNATLLLGAEGFPNIYPVVVAVDGDRSIPNNVIVASGVLNTSKDYGSNHELNLQGEVTLVTDTTINNYGGLLSFEGSVSETDTGTNLTVYADSPVIFDGNTNITGRITAQTGAILFGDGFSLPRQHTFDIPGDTASIEEPFVPTPSLVAAEYGYIGLIEETANQRLQALSDFLGLFDPVLTTGTIGLDTAPFAQVQNSYAGPIDLTGFDPSVRIGSITGAEYTGLLTPAGTHYRFGNGGGTLLLGSTFTDDGSTPRGLEVISDYDSPLTVYINSSSNSFTGNVVAENSAIIFGNAPGTLPSGVQFNLNAGGYIGSQDTSISPATFLSHFDTGITTGLIGFDSQDQNTTRVIEFPIDLSAFTAPDAEFYLSSSTLVNLVGPITLPSGSNTYRFAGYKGGFLNIASVLPGANSVVVGDNDVFATSGTDGTSFNTRSGIMLQGVNTYTGGTTLEAGELVITNAASLGTGSLTVNGGYYYEGESAGAGDGFYDYYGFLFNGDLPTLIPNSNNINLANNVVLSTWLNTEVSFDSGDRQLELSGIISGYGGLHKTDEGTLTLSGHNTFEGGIYISEGVLKLEENDSAGAGPIGFGVGAGQQVFFNSAAPVIRGLYTNYGFEDSEEFSGTSTVYIETGGTLTFAPGISEEYNYSGTIAGDGAIAFTGMGTQELSGSNTFTGGTSIQGGATLRTNSSNALGSSGVVAARTGFVSAFEVSTFPAVTLDNGNLLLTGSSTLNANVSFGPGGGTLGGNGTLNFDNTLTIGEAAILSAGESVGTLILNGSVQFASAGTLIVELGQNGSGNIIADTILAANLEITSTAIDPFNISLRGVGGTVPVNFDPAQGGSWLIVASSGGITNFDLNAISLQLSTEFNSTSLAFGIFNLQAASGTVLGNAGTDNILMLTFTPVPEPSTVVLLGLGLMVVGFRRRRRA